MAIGSFAHDIMITCLIIGFCARHAQFSSGLNVFHLKSKRPEGTLVPESVPIEEGILGALKKKLGQKMEATANILLVGNTSDAD